MKTLLVTLGALIVLTGCSGNTAPNTQIPSDMEKQTYSNFKDTISKDHIYMNDESLIAYATDVQNPQVLLEHGTLVVVNIKIGNIKEARLNGDQVETPIEVIEYEVLDGNIDRPLNEITISGGIITLKSYLKTLNEYQIEKRGYLDFTQEELENHYVEVFAQDAFDYVPGASYVVLLVENNDTYTINNNGYGTFVENDSKNQTHPMKYKNVLTGEVSDLILD